ncbi:NUDIX domain protein [Aquimixticola soesokkakensis]|uniref:NUDIX domain protein n=1 Tax=Aquimixticola soesokkakensis TaxID=1519096 RepID=A0A1Y5RLZ7_9RHOB|nr:NUDIX hydrolase [Aquimixticola soesokkakensis]SLN19516.1 NUDIX domain protein [Aquimixticola soesokkakensis]
MEHAPIRDAATLVLVRFDGDGPRVLMGQRGASAVFLPHAVVFPGGAVEAQDAGAPLRGGVPMPCQRRLTKGASEGLAHALQVAALRELREETGLVLPDASSLRFIFRAITPPARTRRFDARFFVGDAAGILGDPDDFSAADGELSDLRWYRFSQAHRLGLHHATQAGLRAAQAAIGPAGLVDSPGQVLFFDGLDPALKPIR